MGFNTIGKPKIIGSFILKIAGPIDSFPNVFNSADFKRSNNKHKPNVAPPHDYLKCLIFSYIPLKRRHR